MPIDSKNKLMKGIMGHHGDGFEGLNPKLPTPSDYAGYVKSVESMGGTPATERELLDGIAAVDTMRANAAAQRDSDETSILAKLRITKDDLRKLKIALDRVGN